MEAIVLYYTNGSTTTKTFHGVTFRPGETKEVFGIINDPKFVQSSMRQEPPQRFENTLSKSEDEESEKKPTRKRATKLVEPASNADEDKKEDEETSSASKDTSSSGIDK